jgi:hypothetical protein
MKGMTLTILAFKRENMPEAKVKICKRNINTRIHEIPE